MNKVTSTSFFFIIPEYIEDFASYNIEVRWSPPLNREVSGPIFDNGHYRGQWRAEAAEFYKTGIIADIIVDWDC